MRKLTLFIAVALIHLSLFSQSKGFFFTERDPRCYSSNGKFSIETEDGCFIVTEVNILTPSFDQTEVDIFKFSAEGELIEKVEVGRDLEIAGLFHFPDEQNLYYLILVNFENTVSVPRIVCFDDNLNICSSVDVELPPEIEIPIDLVYAARAMVDSYKKVYYTFYYMGSYGSRVHMRFTLDGQFETFTIDHENGLAGSPFLFPDGSCWSYYGSILARFDDSLNLNRVHVFQMIVDEPQSDGLTHQVWVDASSFPTAVALPDSSFLISEEITERWLNPNYVVVDSDYNQLAFFKSSFDGVVEKVIIVGSRDTLERPAHFQAIDYVNPKAIYLCGYQHLEPDSFGTLVIPNKIFIKKVDNDLNLIWEKSYMLGANHYMPMYLLATKDGGCLIAGRVMYDINEEESDLFVLKINADGTVGNDEILVEDILPYAFYPNPAHNELHLKFSPDVQPIQVELYDLQGRLVRTQRSNFEHIDMSQLPTGTYTMRVTLEDGETYTDKVVKE